MESAMDIFARGGWAMWPLAVLSVVSVAVTLERLAFWTGTHRAAGRLEPVAAALRVGAWETATRLAKAAGSAHGRFVEEIVVRRPAAAGSSAGHRGDSPRKAFESAILEQAELARREAERFHATHASIITSAPMLGILGTVTGIIRSFNLLAGSAATGELADPARVAPGIAEALITTAAGLIVALLTLFPHAVFRGWAEGFLSRLEVLGAAALGGLVQREDGAAVSASAVARPSRGDETGGGDQEIASSTPAM